MAIGKTTEMIKVGCQCVLQAQPPPPKKKNNFEKMKYGEGVAFFFMPYTTMSKFEMSKSLPCTQYNLT